jgi:hypothetical protein
LTQIHVLSVPLPHPLTEGVSHDEEVKEVMDDLLETLETMNQPLQTSRTRESGHTELTNYTIVTDEMNEEDDDDPIDVEKLKKEMRSAYLKEWGDMRGLTFENDEEAEQAFENSKKKVTPPKTPPPLPADPPPVDAPPAEEEELKPATPVKEETKPATPTVEDEVKVESLLPETKSQVESPLHPEAEDRVTPLPSSRRPSNRSRSSSKSSKSRRKSSLFQTVALQIAGGKESQNDSDEENNSKKDDYREKFPQSELDALLGFFPELRSEISELLRQKRHLKLDISEWKAEFFLKNGREANWDERKSEIGELYEKYHEVGYKANKALKELREAEDDLLKSWETRRSKMTTRPKKQQPQPQQQEEHEIPSTK